MIKAHDWLENQFETAKDGWNSYPATQDLLQYVEETVETEIKACENAEDIRKTDYAFFLECRKAFPIFRLEKILCKAYGDSYVSKYTESYTQHTVGFHIAKYYDTIGPSVIKEIVKCVGFDFTIQRDKFDRLTIIVKDETY